jgi:hypothetical protein
MMNRIAVMLRGHMRTWEYLKPAVVEFYESIAHNVDYYIATWDNSSDRSSLIRSLSGLNVIAAIVVPKQPEYYVSWGGPAWLSYNLIPYKRVREKEVTYDAVFDTRPDVIYELNKGRSVIPPQPNTLYTTMLTNLKGNMSEPDSLYYIGLKDHFFMMTSEVYDIHAQRFLTGTPNGCHAELLDMCKRENLHACVMDWVTAEITRPNAISRIPNARDYFNNKKTKTNWADIQHSWTLLPQEEKLDILKRNNIPITDYITDSMMSSVISKSDPTHDLSMNI